MEAFNKNRDVMKDTLQIYLKRKVFNEYLIPVMMYNCEIHSLENKI